VHFYTEKFLCRYDPIHRTFRNHRNFIDFLCCLFLFTMQVKSRIVTMVQKEIQNHEEESLKEEPQRKKGRWKEVLWIYYLERK
jgi:hypothetical protein